MNGPNTAVQFQLPARDSPAMDETGMQLVNDGRQAKDAAFINAGMENNGR